MQSVVVLKSGLETSIESTLFQLIGEINRRVSSGTDYRKILDFIFSSLESVIPYDRMGIALLNEEIEDPKLKLEWVKSIVPYSHLDLNYSASIRGSSLEKLLELNQPRILNDLIQYSALKPNSESTKLALLDGIRSSLTCPLRAGNRPIGVLFFSSTRTNTYQDAHVDTFLSIAEELSVVIDHGRLRQNSQQVTDKSRNFDLLLHDLRSPLGVIQGFVQASMEEPWFQTLDADAKNIFDILLRNSGQMFGLLNELMEVAELNSRSDTLAKADVDFKKFVSEISNLGSVLCSKKKLEFVCRDATVFAAPVRFDQERIRRVLENLLSNAIKYSGRGRKVAMMISNTNEKLTISVIDQGQGIPETEMPKLFREFGKTSTRPTEGESSTGLGLAIAKKLIVQHGGEIGATSIVGQGSAFTFSIPLA